jgi:hypothetical protein
MWIMSSFFGKNCSCGRMLDVSPGLFLLSMEKAEEYGNPDKFSQEGPQKIRKLE